MKSRVKRLFGGDRDVPARWRALKRLAIQGHDHEREQRFFPMEIRSARFVTDWPLHWNVWGVFRFWFGVAYQGLSNFGRSVLRPAIAFLVLVIVSAAIYLGESEAMNGGAPKSFVERLKIAALQPVSSAAALRAAHPCPNVRGENIRPLEADLAKRTDAVSEAMHLAWANGSVVGGIGGPDSARRTYGCLYGFVEDRGGNAQAIVPPGVSLWSTVQKTLSVILIFLFGLAVRNMLRVR